jgi:hypothetical protein
MIFSLATGWLIEHYLLARSEFSYNVDIGSIERKDPCPR